MIRALLARGVSCQQTNRQQIAGEFCRGPDLLFSKEQEENTKL